MKKLAVLVLLTITLLMVACEKNPSVDMSKCVPNGEPMEITMQVYPNNQAVNKAIDELSKSRVPDVGVDGFALWNENADGTMPTKRKCTIHVSQITSMTDPDIETWGHELAHCVCGSYHKKGQR